MKNIKILLLFLLMGTGAYAQVSCTDLSVYPMTKNKGSVAAYTLKTGYEEKAAQTFYYSGPGSISQVRVYGNLPAGLYIPLNIVVYSVDANGRPATAIKTVPFTWYFIYNYAGYLDINMGNVIINSDFALAVEIPAGTSQYRSFDLSYNGDGDGRGEDLASIAGTSTGFNWTSANSTFSKDGDFYILPLMNNFITSAFEMSSNCTVLNNDLNFTNKSSVSNDSMFNKLGNPKYSGKNYLYSWDFGDNTAVSHLLNPSHKYTSAGMYSITLTVTFEGISNTCTDTYKKYISTGLAVTAKDIVNATCYGDNNGSVTASPSGGVPPYFYSIDGYNYYQSPIFNNLRAGVYTLFVKDSFTCISTSYFAINQPGQIVPVTWGTANSTCGKSNGSLSIMASGGTGSLKYSIDGINFQTSGLFTNLAAGHKIVIIKDSIGCTSTHAMDISDASGPVLAVTSYSNIICNGNKDGSIILTATGGTGTLQYSIDGKTYQSSGNFSNLAPGSYGVMVKDDNGCIDGTTVTLTQPQPLLFSTTTVPATCHGSKDGSVSILNARGGTGTYSFSVDGKTYQSGTIFNGLKAGSYPAYIKDAAGCIAMSTFSITEPDQLSATATVSNLKCNGSGDGSINVTVTGGTKPYSFSIDGTHFQPVGTFTNLSAGTYSVYIHDVNGCFYMATSAVVTQPTPVIASITTTNATCGNMNGKILAQASGGSGSGYQYSIDYGNTYNSTGLFSNLKDSSYSLIIMDSKNCVSTFIVDISSTNGPQISTINHTDVSCHGGLDGSISIGSVTGGTGALSYSIDGFTWRSSPDFSGLPAASYVVRVRDAVGCTGVAGITIKEPSAIVIVTNPVNPSCYFSSTGSVTVYAAGGNGTLAYSLDGIYFQSSNEFTKLPAGHYIVFVRDAGHCSGTASFTLTDPPQMTIMNTGILNVTCSGAKNGAITVYASGGTGKLMYALDESSFQTSNKFNGLSGGIYAVFVKDSNNCIIQTFARITEPTAMNAEFVINNVACSGGSTGAILLTISGGTPPYTYQWSNFSTSKNILDLRAGNYTVFVTDANGCSFNATYTVNQPAQPIIINGAIFDSHVGSNDGSIKLTLTGGVGFYNFLWTDGETTQDRNNLAPGKYTVIVRDANNCQISATFQVNSKTAVETIANPDINVNLYPNPADNMIYLDAGGRMIDRITIISIDGKTTLDVMVNDSKPKIDTRKLMNGIYIVGYKIDGVYYHQRLEIQR